MDLRQAFERYSSFYSRLSIKKVCPNETLIQTHPIQLLLKICFTNRQGIQNFYSVIPRIFFSDNIIIIQYTVSIVINIHILTVFIHSGNSPSIYCIRIPFLTYSIINSRLYMGCTCSITTTPSASVCQVPITT